MTSKLTHKSTYEGQDELEATLSQAYASLQSQLASPYQASAATASQRLPLTQALLYAILTNAPPNPTAHLNHLTTITTDGYATFVGLLTRLVNDSYTKLMDQPRTQLIWTLKQLMGLYASEVDNLCLLLLRQINGGDISTNNVWLAIQMLDTFNSNIPWLVSNPGLLTGALYTYLRLLPDHNTGKNLSISELRENEIKFCIFIMREHFQECMSIGRDLIRLLHDVALIPEFETIWKDLLCNPGVFRTPSFESIAQLYAIRTPTKYIQSRLTPEMESQIKFMLTHVRMGNQRRYQAWFTQKFLNTPESESLVPDLIRYVCCVHHPTNQILQSDILPRWALVGWLLKCCKSNHVEANAKLALLYDWLFFGTKTDNIMNIEPGILVMVHSIPKYSDMTNSLLEFLFLLMEHYDPPRKDVIHRGVLASIDILVGKGVVRSLEPLSTPPSVASSLREKLIQTFPTYCKAEKVTKVREEVENQQQTVEEQQEAGDSSNLSKKRRRTCTTSTQEASDVEKVSKALQASTSSSHQEAVVKTLESCLTSLTSPEHAEKVASQLTDVFKKASYEVFSPLTTIPNNKPEGDETKSITSTLLRLYVGSCNPHVKFMLLYWSREGLPVGTRLLCYVSRLAEELEVQEYVEGLVNSPEANSDAHSEVSEEAGGESRGKLKRLRRLGSGKQRSLFYNAVADGYKAVFSAFKAYEELLASVRSSSTESSDEELRGALMSDLNTCLQWHMGRLQRVLPSVYRYLPGLTVGNVKLMKLAISVLMPSDIFNFELRLAMGEMCVLGSNENATNLIKASLSWDAFEQHYFWKLLLAEAQAGYGSLTSLDILRICTSLMNPEVDVEAMSGMLSMLRSSPPTSRLVLELFSSSAVFSKLVVAVFITWFQSFFQALVSSLSELSKDGEKVNWAILDALLNHMEDSEVSRNIQDKRGKDATEVKQALIELSTLCNQEDCSETSLSNP